MTESTPLSMLRAHAPEVGTFRAILRDALNELADPIDNLALAFRSHRYNGTLADRMSAITWIGDRIVPKPSPERVLITNGTMNTIMMLSSQLAGHGSNVLVEEMTFPIVYSLFGIAGANVHRVEMDEFGITPESFERQCASLNPKLIYLNPTIQSPTAIVMPETRRRQIAAIARKYGVLILEDEAQALYLDDAPPSFATIAPEITWYILGMSKYLPPAFRISFAVAPSVEALETVLQKLRPVTTWHPAPIVAELATHLVSTGEAGKLLQAARHEVHARQAIVSAAFQTMQGFRGSTGLHFWLEAPRGVESLAFSQALLQAGVEVRPSRLYSGPATPCLEGIRPTIGQLRDRAEVHRAIEILHYARETLGSPKGGSGTS